MFSGIRSILFGYSEPDNSVNKELISESASSKEEASSCNKTTSKTSEKSLSSDTSALLEQTLTAATTKITEQLLLPSTSIEQLQSSNHQLLPSLTEQHEEEALKRNKQNQLSHNDATNQPEELDDECLDVDSWELLDLVEKPQVSSLNSTVQGDSGDRSTGILKQAGKDSALTQRHKPKVSFETPDLVSDKQKIEPTTKPKDSPKPGSSRSRNKKKSKQTKVAAQLQTAERPTIEKASEACEPVQGCSPAPDAEVVDFEVTQNFTQSTIESPKPDSSKLPALNYAAALYKNKVGIEQSNLADAKPDETAEVRKSVTEGPIDGLKGTGPSKRNRPVSSSSWSSSDEIETVESKWSCALCEVDPNIEDVFEKIDKETDPIDHESLVSSGFSECDYGYGDLNDFYVRPRKGQSKRRGISANSSSLLTSMSKRSGDRSLNKKQPETSAANSCSKVIVLKSKVETSKNIKPKKKKMVMTPSSRSDFLKKRSEVMRNEAVPASTSENSRAESESSFIRPPAPMAPSANTSSNDSSDIADMDESWYVTPPPCFTGANTLKETQPRAKEAARENELIERPAIYIASGSKRLEPGASTTKSSINSMQTKPKAIVLRKVNKGNMAIGLTAKSNAKKKSTSSVVPQTVVVKKQKAWENKFIVDAWDDDEQDDVDDFDNLFAPDRARSVNGKAKKLVKAKTIIAETKPIEQAPIEKEPTAVEESNFSSPSLTPIDISEGSSIEIVQTDELASQVTKENIVPAPAPDLVNPNKKPVGERKVLVQVRPIEPERQPGWQLRKRRSKRRLLISAGQKIKPTKEGRLEQSESVDANSSSSARSSPTLIDRIGSSIVANLTNLTNGFPGGSIQVPPRSAIEEVEKLNQTGLRVSSDEAKLVARRRLSRGFMDRQNDCAKVGNSNRRADRRVKMFGTINGVSVNRKVHTSFH